MFKWLDKGPDELFLIDTVAKAKQYGIAVTGYFRGAWAKAPFSNYHDRIINFFYSTSDLVAPSRESASWACLNALINPKAANESPPAYSIRPTEKGIELQVDTERSDITVKTTATTDQVDFEFIADIAILGASPQPTHLCRATFTRHGELLVQKSTELGGEPNPERVDFLTALPSHLPLSDIAWFIETHSSQ